MNIFIASKASVRLTLVGNHCGRRHGCFFFIDFQQSPEPRNPPPSKFYLRGGGNLTCLSLQSFRLSSRFSTSSRLTSMGFSRGGWLDWLRKADKRWLWIVLGSRWIGDRVPDYGSSRLDCRLTFARRLPWCRALPSPWIIHPKLSHTAGTVVRITMRRQLWSFCRQLRFLAFHSRQITPTTHLVLHPHADPCRWAHGSWWLWKKEFFAMWTSIAVLHIFIGKNQV